MKIPETSANVGAYYGNEENGQWQPNGVMLDSGVGGGVVGSGDAGVQRAPLYPVHLPRQHMSAGYVVAGAYYPPAPFAPPAPDDFADYMWMENEEEFDKQVMQQLEEEALMEQCIEAMLEDEQRERHNGHQYPTTSNGAPSLSLEETVSRSRLNPLAAEFVPTGVTNTQTPTQPSTEEKQESKPAETPRSEEPPQKEEEAPAPHTDTHAEPLKDPTPPPSDPPEVSAAHIQDDAWRDKHKKKPNKDNRETRESRETKTKSVSESKDNKPKSRAAATRSDSKLVRPERERESRARSQDAADNGSLDTPTPAPVEEPQGPKPINYAAAAKANKPKKASSPPRAAPPADKPSPPLHKQEKKKTEKPMQRKNSAK